jgi:phosphoribosylformylglycinamidine synthase
MRRYAKMLFLFGEAQGRIVVTVKPEQEDAFIESMLESDAEFEKLGEVNRRRNACDGESFETIGEAKDIL